MFRWPSQLWLSVSVLGCYAAAMIGLGFALKHLELSVAYAIWAVAGTAITAIK